MPFGHGGRGFKMGGWMGDPDSSAFSVAADKLGLTVDELVDELANGKSIAELAAEKGVDPQEISDAYDFLMGLRLETQLGELREGRPGTSVVELSALTHTQRELLRQAFARIAEVQKTAEREFPEIA